MKSILEVINFESEEIGLHILFIYLCKVISSIASNFALREENAYPPKNI